MNDGHTGMNHEQIQCSENDKTHHEVPDSRFDPAKLRLSQNFGAEIGVRKAILTVPVRKPDRQSFVRVNPNPEYRLEVAILELKTEGEVYLVDPMLLPELPGEFSARIVFTTINRQGTLFLWPVRLPNPDGRRDEWSRSSLEAAAMANNRWIRIVPNMSLGAYEVYEATADLPEPEWPDVSFPKLLEIAFRDNFIRRS